jgi:DinB superfamily
MDSGTHKQDTHSRLAWRLREQAHDIQRMASGLDEESLAEHTVPGKWSLKEILCHVWRVQEVFEGRIEALLTQTNPAIVPYYPEQDSEFEEKLRSTAGELLEGFLAEREQLVTLLASLSAGDWRRSGTHPEYPHYDLHFQVEYMAYHEAHHIYQMLQRRAPLGKVPH